MSILLRDGVTNTFVGMDLWRLGVLEGIFFFSYQGSVSNFRMGYYRKHNSKKRSTNSMFVFKLCIITFNMEFVHLKVFITIWSRNISYKIEIIIGFDNFSHFELFGSYIWNNYTSRWHLHQFVLSNRKIQEINVWNLKKKIVYKLLLNKNFFT